MGVIFGNLLGTRLWPGEEDTAVVDGAVTGAGPFSAGAVLLLGSAALTIYVKANRTPYADTDMALV